MSGDTVIPEAAGTVALQRYADAKDRKRRNITAKEGDDVRGELSRIGTIRRRPEDKGVPFLKISGRNFLWETKHKEDAVRLHYGRVEKGLSANGSGRKNSLGYLV